VRQKSAIATLFVLYGREAYSKCRLCFKVEVEPANTQMLLGCLLLSMQDAAAQS
jgi:hypothetical protein